MTPINHFIYGKFKRQPSKLSNEEVGRFYDNFVSVSVDVIPTAITASGKKVLLGLRKEEPKTWWTIGRGMVPGESPTETASRALQEEFEINANPHDFKLICINSSIFPLRRQPPEENGRQCLVLVFSLEIIASEMNRFISQSGKYHEVKCFPQSEIKINSKMFDPSIIAAVEQI